MGETIADPVHGTHDIVRDGTWKREVQRELVRAVVDREKRAIHASVLAWFVLVVAAIPLPNTGALVIPLALRLVSLTFSHWSTNMLRNALDRGDDLRRYRILTVAALAVAGVSWALLLYPYEALSGSDASIAAIRGIVVVAVAMVAVTYAPMRWPMLALVGTFAATLIVSILLNPELVSPWMILTVLALSIGIAAFALAAAHQHIDASQALVDNRRLGEELAKALAQAEFLSRCDPLTGLYNRRVFFEDGEWAGDAGPDAQLLTIDLDHFKAINDEFGHEAGDRVLVATADAMRAVTRTLPKDQHRAVRLGGEEFALLLSGVGRAAATGLAEALRLRIERIPERIGLPEARVSASIGIAECRPGEDLDAVLRRSDLAMYRAKDRGRNCVVGEAA